MSILRIASPNLVCNVYSKLLFPSVSPANKGLKLRTVFYSFIVPGHSRRRAFSISGRRRVGEDRIWFGETEAAVPKDSSKSIAASTHWETTTSALLDISTSAQSTERETSVQSDTLPWYLRQQASIPAQVQKSVEIPDLPPNPPPLLETLLEYISVTAGLDNLQLLDLRQIDPPPALGSKLIMIFATARSEKHLHVSADRLCRHLRREHGLKANAAGLLGRNELKIKLRRKAKRMRMFANMSGPAPEGNIDDGIRTGWICCTIGKIAAHPLDTDVPGDDIGGFVGFRDTKPGVNVVVQMFTEEKRAETDLETLWGGVLKTHQTKNKQADETLKQLQEDMESLENDTESQNGNQSLDSLIH